MLNRGDFADKKNVKLDQSLVPGQWTKVVVDLSDMELMPGTVVNGMELGEFGGIVAWDRIVIHGESWPTDSRVSFERWLGGETDSKKASSKPNENNESDSAKGESGESQAKAKRTKLQHFLRWITRDPPASVRRAKGSNTTFES